MNNIDSLIIRRLGEHQRKVDFINSNMKTQQSKSNLFHKMVPAILSVAACAIILLTIFPQIFMNDSFPEISISAPEFSEYRGNGYDSIAAAIRSGNYTEALSLVDGALLDTEVELALLSLADEANKENEYLIALYNETNENLLWCKIFLLVNLERKDDLVASRDKYLKNSSFTMHRAEVKKILEKFK